MSSMQNSRVAMPQATSLTAEPDSLIATSSAVQTIAPFLSNILKEGEERLPVKSLVDILDKAWVLTEAERTAEERHKAIVTGIDEKSEATMPLSYLYHRAETLSIPKAQIERVRKLYYPSDEEQLAQLESIGAKPDPTLIISKYMRELVSCLKRTFPFDEESTSTYKKCWGYKQNGLDRYDIFHWITYPEISKEEERRFLWLRWKEKIRVQRDSCDYNTMACLTSSPKIRLKIFSPKFTLATADKLKELQARFNFLEEIIYNYPLGELKD